jgi:hypothetical protein
MSCRVVILGIRRLTGGQAGGLAHCFGYEPGILDIFLEYSLKYLEYTRICLNISLLSGRGGLPGEAGAWAVWAGGRVDAQTTLVVRTLDAEASDVRGSPRTSTGWHAVRQSTRQSTLADGHSDRKVEWPSTNGCVDVSGQRFLDATSRKTSKVTT